MNLGHKTSRSHSGLVNLIGSKELDNHSGPHQVSEDDGGDAEADDEGRLEEAQVQVGGARADAGGDEAQKLLLRSTRRE